MAVVYGQLKAIRSLREMNQNWEEDKHRPCTTAAKTWVESCSCPRIFQWAEMKSSKPGYFKEKELNKILKVAFNQEH